jgi:SIR2-like domain
MNREATDKNAIHYYSNLAASMARNSIYHSVNRNLFRSVSELVLNIPPPDAPPPQIIVVVGAGASNAAADLPRGQETAQFLRDEMTRGFGPGGEKFIDEEIESLALQFNLDEGDFETILFALSKFNKPNLLRRLRSIFGRRHHPWLGYEILAHCLKHRFIDAIINFNFDEILDQSITDEIGKDGFHKTILDGDCPHSIVDIINDKDKFNLPIYLKLHGSASQPSSLRFTRDSYTALPEGFVKILGKLFAVDRPAQVLVLGYAMQAIEFNHFLRRTGKNRLARNPMTFYFVQVDDPRLRHFSSGIDPKLCQLIFPDKTIDIAEALEAIWSDVCTNFKVNERPRGIERHQLITMLFDHRKIRDWKISGTPDDERDQVIRLRTYFRDRACVEVAIAVAKAKGFVCVDDLLSGRAGQYFKLYRETPSRVGAADATIRSLNDVCEKLGLRTHGYGDSAITSDVKQEDAEAKLRTLAVKGESFETAARRLAKASLSQIRGADLTLRPDVEEKFSALLLAMYRGEEVEVSVGSSGNHTLSFESAEVLPTLSALKWRTEQLIVGSDFKAIACTAKAGYWFLQEKYVEKITERKAKLFLVVSDTAYEKELVEKFGSSLSYRWLPWWLHNRNVTVFLDGERPMVALSFERRMRASIIAPVLLTAEADVRHSWELFLAYWVKASTFTEDDPSPFTHGRITKNDIHNAERILFGQLTALGNAGFASRAVEGPTEP